MRPLRSITPFGGQSGRLVWHLKSYTSVEDPIAFNAIMPPQENRRIFQACGPWPT
ncbi:hypothetical protein M407DRAFT_242204 [Tulasnella calospora MUT 4182]|uniref:Uncharacterized protein n=1 Tax=Tulasnella calospora MUT 4182 TaxID=1051891 RepID=A0A0C3QRL8_9AGAM|nr:hypothetical protein M407DRAFT_242204 [Tulasnella calospora MUT 4182]